MTDTHEDNNEHTGADSDAQKSSHSSSHYPRNHPDTIEGRSAGNSFLIIIGIVLIAVGALTLLPSLLGPLWMPIQATIRFALSMFWPVVLIVVGIFIVRAATNSKTKESENIMDFRPSMPPQGTRLMRSRKNRLIGGVCGGIAEYFNLDPSIVRILTVILFLIPGISWIVYVIAWIIIPLDNR